MHARQRRAALDVYCDHTILYTYLLYSRVEDGLPMTLQEGDRVVTKGACQKGDILDCIWASQPLALYITYASIVNPPPEPPK
jgi:hypothetical protein